MWGQLPMLAETMHDERETVVTVRVLAALIEATDLPQDPRVRCKGCVVTHTDSASLQRGL